MMHEVRVFDGNGKLKEIIQPVFDYENKPLGNKTMKTCPVCGKQKKMNGNAKFCSTPCSKKHISQREKKKRDEQNRLKAMKPTVPCELCGTPVTGRRVKYCGAECDKRARQLKDMNNRDRNNAILLARKKEIANAEPRC